jgi:hypothetical protein
MQFSPARQNELVISKTPYFSYLRNTKAGMKDCALCGHCISYGGR